MRKGKLSFSEIEAAEKAKDQRTQTHRKGFAKMKERDSGWSRFNNGTIMRWPTVEDKHELEEGETRMSPVPEGCFVLIINGQSALFDAEEFRRALRWA